MKLLPFLAILAVTGLIPFVSNSQEPAKPEPRTGIKGFPAPPLGVDTWINLPEGKERLGMPDFQGKVLAMLFFQATCTACEYREFPVMKQLVEEFEGDDGIAFVAIQTTFEDFTSNSELQLKPVAEKHKLSIPFGHLAKSADPNVYSLNVAYNTPGTPWWVVIDKEGKVAFNANTMDPQIGIANLRKLIAGASVE